MNSGELQEFSIENWRRIPEYGRKACIAHLRTEVPAEAIERWRNDLAQHGRIGETDPLFHLGPGMAVRNLLRDVIRDQDLPPVYYPDMPGQAQHNWDDFYLGALHDLIRQTEPA